MTRGAVLLALATCSGGEPPSTVVEPASKALPEVTATAVGQDAAATTAPAEEIVRETLFSSAGRRCGYEDGFSVDYDSIQTLASHLPECGGYYYKWIARPDASSIVMTVCVEPLCPGHSIITHDDAPGRTTIYESRDGGVTWERLAIFDLLRRATRVLPEGDGEVTELLLETYGA